jgi:DNA invertase Pin-like site-specific DNA recombinase
MKYVIYLRVSTKKQDERTQLHHCVEFLKSRHGGPFQYLVFSDSVTSKKCIEKRKGFQEAKVTIQAGDILVAMRLDRISRNTTEINLLVDYLERINADILLVEQPGVKNKIMLGVYAGMAVEEIKTLRARVKEKLDVKVSRGERTTISIPYGKSLDENSLVAVKNKDGDGVILKPGILLDNAQELETLELMCRLFDAGMSYQSIGKELAKRGFLNRAGKVFQKTSILRILHRTGRCRPRAQAVQVQEYALLHA